MKSQVVELDPRINETARNPVKRS